LHSHTTGCCSHSRHATHRSHTRRKGSTYGKHCKRRALLTLGQFHDAKRRRHIRRVERTAVVPRHVPRNGDGPKHAANAVDNTHECRAFRDHSATRAVGHKIACGCYGNRHRQVQAVCACRQRGRVGDDRSTAKGRRAELNAQDASLWQWKRRVDVDLNVNRRNAGCERDGARCRDNAWCRFASRPKPVIVSAWVSLGVTIGAGKGVSACV
jgi:hypothetical protein